MPSGGSGVVARQRFFTGAWREMAERSCREHVLRWSRRVAFTPRLLLAAARKQAASREILLWMAPKAFLRVQ